MEILLIQPRGPMYRFGEGIFRKPIRYSPITLTSLASLVPKNLEAKVELIDEGIERVDYSSFNPDLVGISSITGSSLRSYKIADHFRKRNIPVILGGVHPTLMPEEAKQHADSVVTGFAEETWPELLADFKRGELKEFYRQNPDMKLEDLPIPRRDLLKPMGYVTIHSVQATRGCTNKCDFCVAPVVCHGKMYFRPVQEVITELESLKERDLLFVDVSPIEDRRYALELYNAMIPLKKRWMSPSTLRIADDPELLEAARKSGCKGLLLGLESVSQDTLKGIRKNFNSRSSYEDQIKRLHDNGIAINGCFVFGSDNDSKDVFDRTTEFVYKNNIDLPRYTVYTPFPGTPLFSKLNQEGRILNRNWSLYDAQHVVFQPKNMSPEELQEGHHRAWKQTYSIGSITKRVLGSGILPFVVFPANIAYIIYSRHLPEFDENKINQIDEKGIEK
jgi:radical SAM superfamily enzyme YgiQ (UPF0313 family)